MHKEVFTFVPKETLRVLGLLCGHVTPSKAILVSLACHKHHYYLFTTISSDQFWWCHHGMIREFGLPGQYWWTPHSTWTWSWNLGSEYNDTDAEHCVLSTPVNPEVDYCSSPFEHFLQLVDSERSANKQYDTPSKLWQITWSGLWWWWLPSHWGPPQVFSFSFVGAPDITMVT